jgi:hypothetical protein
LRPVGHQEASPSPVYGAALLMRFGFTAHPGFKSPSLRPDQRFLSDHDRRRDRWCRFFGRCTSRARPSFWREGGSGPSSCASSVGSDALTVAAVDVGQDRGGTGQPRDPGGRGRCRWWPRALQVDAAERGQVALKDARPDHRRRSSTRRARSAVESSLSLSRPPRSTHVLFAHGPVTECRSAPRTRSCRELADTHCSHRPAKTTQAA